MLLVLCEVYGGLEIRGQSLKEWPVSPSTWGMPCHLVYPVVTARMQGMCEECNEQPLTGGRYCKQAMCHMCCLASATPGPVP